MADMKKCDVCGRVYPGQKKCGLIAGTESSHVSIFDYKNYSENEKTDYRRYETCPICTTRIKNYVASLQIEAECGIEFTPVKTKRCWFCRK